ncbi:uncharacterized protein G2W53_036965 [Senna tora]|uniref:Uncharacterized protein n=1 Tax=Senna tora TaxID=362788 RepID=A0A834SV08_9FABA|nr:uncharacterized protein G2W53_036965 [Senna tora]
MGVDHRVRDRWSLFFTNKGRGVRGDVRGGLKSLAFLAS